MIKKLINKLVLRQNLSVSEAEEAMAEIMDGKSLPSQIAAFITALRMKGETIDEITGSARVMRRMAVKIKTRHNFIVDTCGTGGDKAHTFNISTIAAFVAAGAGVIIAKHGNRSVSSKCGSADLLEELGVNIEAPAEITERCLDEAGIGFLYAPLLHRAMKYAIGPRREIGIRTIFNILGPLTNPAGAQAQLVGVYDTGLTDVIAQVLGNLGCKEAWVVHSSDGLDEISTTCSTDVSRWSNNKVESFRIEPEKLGIPKAKGNDLLGGDSAQNADIARNVLKGEKGAQRDIVVLNAAAAIVCGRHAVDIKEGIARAQDSIDSGRAMEKMESLIKITQE